MSEIRTDVLVIGGGPAGTTFGNLASKRGWKVTLLEKDCHPRFHIGESLLPMNLPIFERLGILEEIRSIGVPKLGADFTVSNSGLSYQTFHFSRALGASPDHAFEVRRSEFDELLFRHCVAAGADARQNIMVRRVESAGNGDHEVTAVDAVGKEYVWKTHFLVDASGRDAFMSSKNGWKVRNPVHASAAVFAHFRGVERRPGSDQGNISIYWFEHGWVWLIPLRDDIMSVGAVCNPNSMRTRRGSLDDFLIETLLSLPEIEMRMKGAEAVTPAQATGNYSYFSRKMTGPGYLVIGDAYAFVDPVFSSGVYLAMNSAERGMEVAEAWLGGGGRRYSRVCRKYQREMRRGLATFSWFIYRFTSPVMSILMGNPKNALKVVQGVISMLAGDVFSNRSVRRRLLIFKTIYAIVWMRNWRAAVASRRTRRLGLEAEFEGVHSAGD